MAEETTEPTAPEGPSPDQRLTLYNQLIEALLAGQNLTAEELQVLAFGILQDPEVDVPIDVQELFNQLQQRQASGAPVQIEDFERAIAGADAIQPDAIAQTIQDTIVGSVAGAGLLATRAAVQGGAAAAAAGVSRFRGAAGAVIPGGETGISGIFKSLLSHPIKKSAIAVGGLMGVGMLTQNQPVTPGPGGAVTSGPGRRADITTTPSVGSGRSNATADIQAIIESMLSATRPGAAGGPLSPDIIALAEGLNIDPSLLQGSSYQTFEPANPLALGIYEFDPSNYPYGATSAGAVAGQPYTGGTTQQLMDEFRKSLGPRGGPTGGLASSILDLKDVMEGTQGVISPGGQIMPRAFAEFRGKALLQHVMDAASRYGVPASLLYGIIALESNFNPNAVGDQGNSHGLAQIYLPAHPDITRRQALDPLFALNWTASNLRNNFRKYGAWEVAAIAHNSPNAANQISQTGTVADRALRQKATSYISTVLDHAGRSGIGNEIFTGEALAGLGSGPAAAAGPDMTASQINNLKSNVRDLWTEWMGPGTADEDFLNQWANWLFNGKKGADDLEQTIQSMSTGRWPTKPGDITWTEWATPYKAQIQAMLEVPKLDNTDSLLHKALDQQVEGRDLDLLIRQDPRWTRTANFRDQYSEAAMQLGRAFGFTS